MASPKELRSAALGNKVVENLQKRGMEGYYCPTSKDAIEKVLELIPEGSSISWGGSETIRSMGLTAKIKEGNFEVYDRDLVQGEEQEELYRKVFSMDCYLTSTNAIAIDGTMVNIDGRSNRIAAIAFGPKNVIVVAGINKVVPTEADAITRAKTWAAPINSARFQGKTPCITTGTCHSCLSPECICNEILITRRSKPNGRIKVIIVGEELGF